MTFDELARTVVPMLLVWGDLDGSPENFSNLRRDLQRVLDDSTNPDGYALARRFDDLGYDVDAKFVVLLDRYLGDINAYMKSSRR